MTTGDLFGAPGEWQPVALPGADLRYLASFYEPPAADALFQQLLADVAWQHQQITLWGKQHWQPRLTAWVGDPGLRYAYSNTIFQATPWTPALQAVREKVQAACGHEFNSVLLNLYRDQTDSMGWHADDEPELGPQPVIASLTLGQARRFRFKPKQRGIHPSLSLMLESGSLLLMAGATQRNWLHGIDKTTTATGPRINLTFRKILALAASGAAK